MDRRTRRRRLRLVVAALSLSLGLLAGELVVRSTHRLEDLHAHMGYAPEIAATGWKRVFLRDYAASRHMRGLQPLGPGFVHDPQLGWDSSPTRLRDGRVAPREKAPDAVRVVVVGDSFAYGDEVAEEESFPAQLEGRLPRGEVLNMGVKAYGVGQMALKYLQHGAAYRPDWLVVSIFEPDTIRTPLTFYRYRKPSFRLRDDGSLEVRGRPIPDLNQVYEELQAELGPYSYLYGLARQTLHARELPEHSRRLIEAWEPTHTELLRQVLTRARADTTHMVLLLIPAAFGGSPSHENRSWRRIAADLGVDLIDLGAELPADHSLTRIRTELHTVHPNRPGHFSAEGNRVVAKLLETYFRAGLAALPTLRPPRPVVFGPGWWGPEGPNPRTAIRWTAQEARLTFPTAHAKPVEVRLRLEVPLERIAPPTLTLAAGDQVLRRWVAREREQDVFVSCPATPGETTLRIHTSQTFNPKRLGLSEDARDLGLKLLELRWRPLD